MTKREFEDLLREYKETYGEPVVVSLVEEGFGVTTYVFNAGLPYVEMLQEYVDASGRHYYYRMFFNLDWFEEIAKHFGYE
jgi:hypothetical protein